MLRLFAGLRPPPEVRVALRAAMGGVEGARWQDDGQLHLTLRFVGEVFASQAEDLAHALGRVHAAPFTLQLSGVGHFERKGRAHTLWAAVTPSPGLTVLQATIERACQHAGLAPEPRKFTPHVTLARLAGTAGPIGGWLADNGAMSAPDWRVSDFELVESTLGTGGSHYRPVVAYALTS